MKLRSAHPSGWALFQSERHRDERGWVSESLRIDALQAHAGRVQIVQQNLSSSRRGVLRGLHHQVGSPQGKLVQVMQGRIHDVVVDIRRGSAYFRRWFAVDLSAEQSCWLWVPPGFAHGFLALEDSVVLYGLTQLRDAQAERAIRWDSPVLGIEWPVDALQLIVSQRDREAPLFDDSMAIDAAQAYDGGHDFDARDP